MTHKQRLKVLLKNKGCINKFGPVIHCHTRNYTCFMQKKLGCCLRRDISVSNIPADIIIRRYVEVCDKLSQKAKLDLFEYLI